MHHVSAQGVYKRMINVYYYKKTRESHTRIVEEYLDSKCQSKEIRKPGILVNIDIADLCGDYKTNMIQFLWHFPA